MLPEYPARTPCENPLCDFLVPASVVYCCVGCDLAHQGGYEIHEGGLLGHSQGCMQRLPPQPTEEELREAELRRWQDKQPNGSRNMTTSEFLAEMERHRG